MTRTTRTSTAPARRRWCVALLLLSAAVALAFHFDVPSRLQGVSKAALAWLEQMLAQLDGWAPVVFVVLYVAACVALMPASFLTLGAGLVFGVARGSGLVFIGATLGAAAAFLVSRYVARDWVTRRFGHRPAFVLIDRAVAEEGWKIVFLTRLAPVFPFFVLNYAYGLTRVRFTHYVAATFCGILPSSTLFVFIGSTLKHAASQDSTLTDWLKRGFILVTAIIALVYLGKVARRALGRLASPAGGDPDESRDSPGT